MLAPAKRIALLSLIAGTLAGLGAALTPGPAAALELLGTRATDVALQVSKGQLIRLDQAADSVFIADPEIADVEVMSPRLIYVFGRMPGQTNLYAVGGGDEVLANLRLTVSPDLARLGTAVDRVAPGSRAELGAAENAVIISGSVGSPAEAADIERLAAVFAGPNGQVIDRAGLDGSNQINLRVRVAEVSRQAVRELGINWEALLSGDFIFGVATGRDFLGDFGEIVRGTGTNTIAAGYRSGDLDVNAVIDALEAEDLVNILAEPNLTAVSGQTATFLAGGEFPVPIIADQNSVTVEFKPFGVSLAFTPTLLGNGRINLRVRPEVSQLSTEGAVQIGDFEIPSLTTRRAETTVEVGSGQSFAIAGLFQRNVRQGDDNLPFLGRLPVIGELFRSTRFQRNETELVIVVTPYLVQPVSQRTLLLPTDLVGPNTPLTGQPAQPAAYGFILK